MKSKLIFGTMLGLLLIASTSFAEDDADKKRLLKEYEKMQAEKAKEAEKLELTRKKALNKLDFYERVVRSVAREEAEVAEYYEIMGEEKARPSIMDEQKAEVTEQTSQAETSQEEIQTTEVKQ